MTELYDAAAAAWDEAVLRSKSGVEETPASQLDRTIAHLYSTVAESNYPHLVVHTAAAAKAVDDPVLLRHHVFHATGHLKGVSEHLSKLREAVSRRLPAVGKQLSDLDQADPGRRSAAEHVPDAALLMSIAHDLDNAQQAAGHVGRHLDVIQPGDPAVAAWNLDHCRSHSKELRYHLGELRADLIRRIPAVGRELERLRAVAGRSGDESDAEWHRSMRARL